MKYLSNKNGFLGIDNDVNFKEKVVVVPFGLEKTVSYGGGTRNGPKEIIKASHQVELYDEELHCEPYKKIGIKTLKPFKIDKDIKKALKKMSDINQEILDKKLFPITFGGEHSITPGCIAPFVKKHKKICLLHFDAHADLRKSYEGSSCNHACAVYEASQNTNLIQVGIRSIDIKEKSVMNLDKTYFAHDMAIDDSWMDSAIDQMTDNVFITFDLDAFDPSILPSTGTPEPGGLLWYETIDFLKQVFAKKNVIGFDIVELCPNEIDKSSDFLAAKLYYKMLSYKFDNADDDDYDDMQGYKEPNNKSTKFDDDDNDY